MEPTEPRTTTPAAADGANGPERPPTPGTSAAADGGSGSEEPSAPGTTVPAAADGANGPERPPTPGTSAAADGGSGSEEPSAPGTTVPAAADGGNGPAEPPAQGTAAPAAVDGESGSEQSSVLGTTDRAAADGGNGPAAPPAPGSAGPADGAARKRKRRRRLRRVALVLLLVLLVPVLAAETALRINYTGDLADGTRSRDRDAMWLGHAWVDGRRTDADLAALARRLEDTGIRDLYVHTGPLEHDGTLRESLYPKARRLVDAVHRELPGVRVQAFLGDVLATEGPDGMRLEKAATRAAVVRSARQVLDAGYDGVHLDLEPLHSGDRNYLSLLDDLRGVTRAEGAQLSVAAHQIDPLPAFHSVWGTVTGHPKWWSQEFFAQVARRVDQIALMSYDTMQPLESLYGGYVAQQTSLALEVTPPTTHLLMGLPFYHENRFGHWNHAETVSAAVRGVRLGLSRTDPGRARFGVAAYIDFAATEEDWTAYREGWVR